MISSKVLVIGGSGHFGRLLIDDLRQHIHCDIVAPPRRDVDLWNPSSVEAALDGVGVAICVAGPFQKLPLTLAEKCIERGVHYIDFADDRDFVRRVRSVALSKTAALPAICSGWSTAPALSGCLTQIASQGIDEVDAIYIHMAPGNRLPRGTGTIESLLHSVGQPFEIWRDGRPTEVRGWTEPRAFSFPPPIGWRTGYLVDVPDHEIFPSLFQAKTVEFRTGAELAVLNRGVSFLRWCVKKRLVGEWTTWSAMLSRIVGMFGRLGHDWGAVGLEVTGTREGRRTTNRISLLARSGGQRIAVLPASVMTAMLLSGDAPRGLVSPADWLTRPRLEIECTKRGFQLFMEGTGSGSPPWQRRG